VARLSVNLNKVALLRNSRHTGVPDLQEFARIAIAAGAGGITVHPRPDERHIRRNDVPALAKLMQPRRPTLELNIEGYPDARLVDIATEVLPEQCTLVPDAPAAFTSEKGWDLTVDQMQLLRPVIATLRELKSRVILFIDPDTTVLDRVIQVGGEGIEIFTGGYAADFRARQHAAMLDACTETARQARERGLVVNVGHDLNLRNLPPLIARIPFLAEASIGHELTADALLMGYGSAVRAYVTALTSTQDVGQA
jgi:pyridoxine 5-phosphate synthase